MESVTAEASMQQQQQQPAHATSEEPQDPQAPAPWCPHIPGLGRAQNAWLRAHGHIDLMLQMLQLVQQDRQLFYPDPPQSCAAEGPVHLDGAEEARKPAHRGCTMTLLLFEILKQGARAAKALREAEAQETAASPAELGEAAGFLGCSGVQGTAGGVQPVREQGILGESSTEAVGCSAEAEGCSAEAEGCSAEAVGYSAEAVGQQPSAIEERDPWVMSWLAQSWEQRTAYRVARELKLLRRGAQQADNALLLLLLPLLPQRGSTQAQEQCEVDPHRLLLRFAVAKSLRAYDDEAAMPEGQEESGQNKVGSELYYERCREKAERRERWLEECRKRNEEKQRRREQAARAVTERRARREEWRRQHEEEHRRRLEQRAECERQWEAARRWRWEQYVLRNWFLVWAPPPPPPPPPPVDCCGQAVRLVSDGLLGDGREAAERADADGAQLEVEAEAASVVGQGGAVAAAGAAGGVGVQAGSSAAQAPCRGWWRPWAVYGGPGPALLGSHVHGPGMMWQPWQWQQRQAVGWGWRGQQQQHGQHQEQQRGRALDGVVGATAAAFTQQQQQQQQDAMAERPLGPAPLLQPIAWQGLHHCRWISRPDYNEEVRPMLQLLQQDWALFQSDAPGEGPGPPGAAEEARQALRRGAAALALFEILELSTKAQEALRVANAEAAATRPPGAGAGVADEDQDAVGCREAPGPAVGCREAPGPAVGCREAPGPAVGCREAPGPAVGCREAPGPPCAAPPAQELGAVGECSAEAVGQQPSAAEERDPWVVSWLAQRWEQRTADRVAQQLRELQQGPQRGDDELLLLPLVPQLDDTQAQEQGGVDPQELLLRFAVARSLQEGYGYGDRAAAAEEQERLAPTRVRHDYHDQCRREKEERRELARLQRAWKSEEHRWRQEAKQRWKEELGRERAERRAQREERVWVPEGEHRRRLAQREEWKAQREQARRRRWEQQALWQEPGCYSQPVRFVSAGLLRDGREEAEEVLAKAGEARQEARGEAGSVVGEGGAVAAAGVAGGVGSQVGSSAAQAPCRGWWRPWAVYGGPGPVLVGPHVHTQDTVPQPRQQQPAVSWEWQGLQQQQKEQQQEQQGQQDYQVQGHAPEVLGGEGCEQHGGLGRCTAEEEALHEWLEEAYRSLGISDSHGARHGPRELQQAYRHPHSSRCHHHHQPHDRQLQEHSQGRATGPLNLLPRVLPGDASSALPTGGPCAQPDVAEEEVCRSGSHLHDEGEQQQQPRQHHQHQQAVSAQGRQAHCSGPAVGPGMHDDDGDLSFLSFLGSHFHPGAGYETEGARMERRQQQQQDDHHRHSRCDVWCSSAERQPAGSESPERAANANNGHADSAGGGSGCSSSSGGSAGRSTCGPGDPRSGDGACVGSDPRGKWWCDGPLRPGLGLAGAGAASGLSKDFARFEQHSSGIGSRLLLRMGWRPGQGLGPARHGRLEPLVPPRRPRALGLGADIHGIEPELPAGVWDAGSAEAAGVTAVEVAVEVVAEAAADVAASATAEAAAAAASVAAAAMATAEEVTAGCVPADVWEMIGA